MAVLLPKFGNEMGNLAPQFIISNTKFQGIYSVDAHILQLCQITAQLPNKLGSNLTILEYVKKW